MITGGVIPAMRGRDHDVFGVTCWRCSAAVEIPVNAVIDGIGQCACGALLEIDWPGTGPSSLSVDRAEVE